VDRDTLGLSPKALGVFLENNVEVRDSGAFNRKTGKRIGACVPMHTFGLPCRIKEIVAVCDRYQIPVVEDAAESLGSYVGNRHTGTFGEIGTLSFNGNKLITTGGGGMIITDDAKIAELAKHITTTAKVPHPYEFVHDMAGYNYQMPNLNAALGCAQVERMPEMLAVKERIAKHYAEFFEEQSIAMLQPIEGAKSNYWLNGLIFENSGDRKEFLEYTNGEEVMTRPIWRPMHRLEMYSKC